MTNRVRRESTTVVGLRRALLVIRHSSFTIRRRCSVLVTAIMTPEVTTVTPDTPIVEVARLMAAQGISGVPVIRPTTGELVGLITELEMIERQAKFELPTY